MSERQETIFRDEEFTGAARLFPVPDLVIFPNIVQALHVDEPRQRQLLRDALSTDSLIAVATYMPGHGPPGAISSAVCLARIISQRQHADGTAEIVVLGLRRAVITKSMSSSKLYREAQIELLSEVPTTPRRAEKLCLQLTALARDALAGWPCGELLHKTLIEQRHLSVMADLLGYWLPLTVTQKLQLLRETRIHRRVASLMAHLRQMPVTPTKSCVQKPDRFPPSFSVN